MLMSTAERVTKPEASRRLGLRIRQIDGKIADGHWRRGVEYHKGPDGRIYIDCDKVREWMAGGKQ
jgi:hypothetical protein